MRRESTTHGNDAPVSAQRPPRRKGARAISPHVKASRRLYDLAVKDANRARWAYTRHAEQLQTALDDWRHAVEDMQRAAYAIADVVYDDAAGGDHVA